MYPLSNSSSGVLANITTNKITTRTTNQINKDAKNNEMKELNEEATRVTTVTKETTTISITACRDDSTQDHQLGGGGGGGGELSRRLTSCLSQQSNDGDASSRRSRRRRRRVRFAKDENLLDILPCLARSDVTRQEKQESYYTGTDVFAMRVEAVREVSEVYAAAFPVDDDKDKDNPNESCNAASSLLLHESLRGMEQLLPIGKDRYYANRRLSQSAVLEQQQQLNSNNNNNIFQEEEEEEKEKEALHKSIAASYQEACHSSVLEAQQRGELDAWIVYGGVPPPYQEATTASTATTITTITGANTTTNDNDNKMLTKKKKSKVKRVGAKLRKIFKRQ